MSGNGKQDRGTEAERIMQGALENSANQEIATNDRERIVDTRTNSDITGSYGGEIGREIAEAIKAGLSSQQQSDGRNVSYGQETGKYVTIEPGDWVVYCTRKGGQGKARGGWFKCSPDEQPTRDNTVVARSLVRVTYDEGQGVLYHKLKFRVERKFRKQALSSLYQPTADEVMAVNQSRNEFDGV